MISSDITATHDRVMHLTHMLPIAVAQTVTLPTPQQLHSRHSTVDQMVRHQLGVSGVSGIVDAYACG